MGPYTKVVIAGKRCTGKTTLFWNLQKQLNWPTFSISQYLRDYIRTYQITPEQVEQKSVEISGDIDQRVENLLKSTDKVIIEGRVFGRLINPVPDTLRLLLTSNDHVRIHRSAGREGISAEKAAQRLFKREDEWIERMEKLYGIENLFDPHYYDLVLDTSSLTPQEVLQKILSKLNE